MPRPRGGRVHASPHWLQAVQPLNTKLSFPAQIRRCQVLNFAARMKTTMKKLAAVLVALACVSVCFGLDITTRSGTAYRKCDVVKVEPDGIRISHDGGAAKISFEELPDALQRQYGFDPAKVAAYRKGIADAKAAAEAKATLARLQADEARKKQAAISEAVAEQQLALQKEAAEAPERERVRKETEWATKEKELLSQKGVGEAQEREGGGMAIFMMLCVFGGAAFSIWLTWAIIKWLAKGIARAVREDDDRNG